MTELSAIPTSSAWLEELDALPVHQLPGAATTTATDLPEAADVVVVGAGLTGIFAAYWLLQLTDLRVLVLDGRCIAGGATGRNGGHLWPHGAAEEQTAEEMRQLIKEWEIDCELVNAGSVSFKLIADDGNATSSGSSTTEALSAEELQQRMGLEAGSYADHGGTLYPKACRIWPAKLVRGVADRLLIQHGTRFRVVEHAPVEEVLSNNATTPEAESTDDHRCVVRVRGGQTTRCRHVVIATNGWTSKVLPELSEWIFPCKNQVVCTASLSPRWQHGLAYGRGAHEFYGIQRSDGRVVLGGARAQVPGMEVGNADDSTLDLRPSAAIREFLGNCFRGEEVVVQREWAGIMGFTRDGLPLVGPVALRPNVFLAAGYNGHGMPRAFRAARAVARMIKGGEAVEDILASESIAEWSTARIQ